MRLSVVLPCLNEAENIARTIQDVEMWWQHEGIDGEIIVVDDGSTDGSREALHDLRHTRPHLKVLRHERNQGYGATLRDGCDAAEEEIIVFMDSDGQFRAKDLGRLLSHLQHVDFVAGRRTHRADPLPRILSALLYHWLIWWTLGIAAHDLNCGMKVFRHALWRRIRPARATGALFNAELFLALREQRIPWISVPVPHYPRRFGKPTGGNPAVILRMFSELRALRKARLVPRNFSEGGGSRAG